MTGATPYALDAARSLGHRIVLVTSNPAKYVAAGIDLAKVDEVLEIETDDYNAEEIAEACRCRRVLGVIALDDHSQQIAATVREMLHLPGATPRAIDLCQDKRQTRLAVTGIGREVGFVEVEPSTSESPLGYPAIVKPSTGSSSLGVYICDDDDSFRSALLNASRSVNSTGSAVPIIVEEAVEGPEFSAELAWETSTQRWILVGLTQTHISPAPHRRELGVVFPGMPGNQIAPEIEEVLQRWLRAVGLEGTVAHVELRLTPNGPALIEINPRVAGGDIPRIVQHSTGVDLVSHYVGLHCGQSADVVLGPVEDAGSIWFISPKEEGVLVSLEQPDRPWPDGVDVVYRPLPPKMSVTKQSRLAYVVATAPTPEQALNLAVGHADAHRFEMGAS
ncbi:ATP-grasp domain-containing protein [Paenarthrobacter nitroguajacolicus]|uniref:ATP-grasp domain-containing protein n=1 Tax=Paenarthrobacter nitroguajacolicus TaxID=211146 RepID=UPI0015BDA3EC|nr:ATP-grasp domain-containing protein [Paenarthrobacter nitroguajacolicus]